MAGSFVFPIHATLIFMGCAGEKVYLQRRSVPRLPLHRVQPLPPETRHG